MYYFFCAARFCPNKGWKIREYLASFHQFPKDEALRELWIKNVCEPSFEPNHQSKICSNHFLPGCFEPSYGLHEQFGINDYPCFRPLRRRLKPDAYPTIKCYQRHSPRCNDKSDEKKQDSAQSESKNKYTGKTTERKTLPNDKGNSTTLLPKGVRAVITLTDIKSTSAERINITGPEKGIKSEIRQTRNNTESKKIDYNSSHDRKTKRLTKIVQNRNIAESKKIDDDNSEVGASCLQDKSRCKQSPVKSIDRNLSETVKPKRENCQSNKTEHPSDINIEEAKMEGRLIHRGKETRSSKVRAASDKLGVFLKSEKAESLGNDDKNLSDFSEGLTKDYMYLSSISSKQDKCVNQKEKAPERMTAFFAGKRRACSVILNDIVSKKKKRESVVQTSGKMLAGKETPDKNGSISGSCVIAERRPGWSLGCMSVKPINSYVRSSSTCTSPSVKPKRPLSAMMSSLVMPNRRINSNVRSSSTCTSPSVKPKSPLSAMMSSLVMPNRRISSNVRSSSTRTSPSVKLKSPLSAMISSLMMPNRRINSNVRSSSTCTSPSVKPKSPLSVKSSKRKLEYDVKHQSNKQSKRQAPSEMQDLSKIKKNGCNVTLPNITFKIDLKSGIALPVEENSKKVDEKKYVSTLVEACQPSNSTMPVEPNSETIDRENNLSTSAASCPQLDGTVPVEENSKKLDEKKYVSTLVDACQPSNSTMLVERNSETIDRENNLSTSAASCPQLDGTVPVEHNSETSVATCPPSNSTVQVEPNSETIDRENNLSTSAASCPQLDGTVPAEHNSETSVATCPPCVQVEQNSEMFDGPMTLNNFSFQEQFIDFAEIDSGNTDPLFFRNSLNNVESVNTVSGTERGVKHQAITHSKDSSGKPFVFDQCSEIANVVEAETAESSTSAPIEIPLDMTVENIHTHKDSLTDCISKSQEKKTDWEKSPLNRSNCISQSKENQTDEKSRKVTKCTTDSYAADLNSKKLSNVGSVSTPAGRIDNSFLLSRKEEKDLIDHVESMNARGLTYSKSQFLALAGALMKACVKYGFLGADDLPQSHWLSYFRNRYPNFTNWIAFRKRGRPKGCQKGKPVHAPFVPNFLENLEELKSENQILESDHKLLPVNSEVFLKSFANKYFDNDLDRSYHWNRLTLSRKEEKDLVDHVESMNARGLTYSQSQFLALAGALMKACVKYSFLGADDLPQSHWLYFFRNRYPMVTNWITFRTRGRPIGSLKDKPVLADLPLETGIPNFFENLEELKSENQILDSNCKLLDEPADSEVFLKSFANKYFDDDLDRSYHWNRRILSRKEEKDLVDHVEYMNARGLTYSMSQFLALAGALMKACVKYSFLGADDLPQSHWLSYFSNRYPIVTIWIAFLKTRRRKGCQKVKPVHAPLVPNFLENLEELKGENKILDSNHKLLPVNSEVFLKSFANKHFDDDQDRIYRWNRLALSRKEEKDLVGHVESMNARGLTYSQSQFRALAGALMKACVRYDVLRTNDLPQSHWIEYFRNRYPRVSNWIAFRKKGRPKGSSKGKPVHVDPPPETGIPNFLENFKELKSENQILDRDRELPVNSEVFLKSFANKFFEDDLEMIDLDSVHLECHDNLKPTTPAKELSIFSQWEIVGRQDRRWTTWKDGVVSIGGTRSDFVQLTRTTAFDTDKIDPVPVGLYADKTDPVPVGLYADKTDPVPVELYADKTDPVPVVHYAVAPKPKEPDLFEVDPGQSLPYRVRKIKQIEKQPLMPVLDKMKMNKKQNKKLKSMTVTPDWEARDVSSKNEALNKSLFDDNLGVFGDNFPANVCASKRSVTEFELSKSESLTAFDTCNGEIPSFWKGNVLGTANKDNLPDSSWIQEHVQKSEKVRKNVNPVKSSFKKPSSKNKREAKQKNPNKLKVFLAKRSKFAILTVPNKLENPPVHNIKQTNGNGHSKFCEKKKCKKIVSRPEYLRGLIKIKNSADEPLLKERTSEFVNRHSADETLFKERSEFVNRHSADEPLLKVRTSEFNRHSADEPLLKERTSEFVNRHSADEPFLKERTSEFVNRQTNSYDHYSVSNIPLDLSKPNGKANDEDIAISKPNGKANDKDIALSKPNGKANDEDISLSKCDGKANDENISLSKLNHTCKANDEDIALSKLNGTCTANDEDIALSKPNGKANDTDIALFKLNGTCKTNDKDISISKPSSKANDTDIALSKPNGTCKANDTDISLFKHDGKANDTDIALSKPNDSCKANDTDISLFKHDGKANDKDIALSKLNAKANDKDISLFKHDGKANDKDIALSKLNGKANDKDISLFKCDGKANDEDIALSKLNGTCKANNEDIALSKLNGTCKANDEDISLSKLNGTCTANDEDIALSKLNVKANDTDISISKHNGTCKANNEDSPVVESEINETKLQDMWAHHVQNIHPKPNSYQCDICNETFTEITFLWSHVTSHVSNLCHICGWELWDHRQLPSHMKQHTGKRFETCTCNANDKDISLSKPNGKANDKDIALSKPNGKANDKDISLSKCDGKANDKDISLFKPNGTCKTNDKDISLSKSNGKANDKDIAISKPNGKANDKDIAISKPNGKANDKDIALSMPNGTCKTNDENISLSKLNHTCKANDKDSAISKLNAKANDKDISLFKLNGKANDKDIALSKPNGKANDKDISLFKLNGTCKANNEDTTALESGINETKLQDMWAHHVKNFHPKPNSYQCDICNETFTESTFLWCHVTSHVSSQCHICDWELWDHRQLQSHMTQHTGKRFETYDRYFCFRCNRNVYNGNNLRQHTWRKHLASHIKGNAFKCSQCQCKFDDIELLSKHVHEHTVAQKKSAKKFDLALKKYIQGLTKSVFLQNSIT